MDCVLSEQPLQQSHSVFVTVYVIQGTAVRNYYFTAHLQPTLSKVLHRCGWNIEQTAQLKFDFFHETQTDTQSLSLNNLGHI